MNYLKVITIPITLITTEPFHRATVTFIYILLSEKTAFSHKIAIDVFVREAPFDLSDTYNFNLHLASMQTKRFEFKTIQFIFLSLAFNCTSLRYIFVFECFFNTIKTYVTFDVRLWFLDVIE